MFADNFVKLIEVVKFQHYPLLDIPPFKIARRITPDFNSSFLFLETMVRQGCYYRFDCEQ